MLAFITLGVAVVVVTLLNEWDIRRRRTRRRRELAASIRRLELQTRTAEEIASVTINPSRVWMTDEPGRMIEVDDGPYNHAKRAWYDELQRQRAARYLREDDPPPAHASIPQWYEEYRAKMRNPRLYVDDSQDSLEVW